MSANDLETTPLTVLHRTLGAKMVEFAGHEMPVQFDRGIVAEHLHTRAQAGLFDVSHMGQAELIGAAEDPAAALEQLCPSAVTALKPGRMRYSVLLSEEGGILDDFMVARTDEADGRLFLVVNAARKSEDFAYIRNCLGGAAELAPLDDRALIALQGPEAEAVLGQLLPIVREMRFMDFIAADWDGVRLTVSRSGYTGEDGFEISVPAEAAERLARRLLDHDAVAPVGLGARDSLRLEAGLCLYGHDLDADTTPVEADLAWTISKPRRESADFRGAQRILAQLEAGPERLRVGLRPEGKAIAREGVEIFDAAGERPIGQVTSGSFGPSLDGPVAMGYVERGSAEAGTPVSLMLRGKPRPAAVATMPFVPHRYKRKSG